jgi:hypothetical protein
VVGGPLEEAAKILAVCLERAAAVASQERRSSKLRLVEPGIVERRLDRCGGGTDRGHGCISSSCWEIQQTPHPPP